MSGANVSPIGRNKEEWLVQATDYRKLNEPPRPRLQRNGTIYLMARRPLLCQGGDFAFPAGCPRRPCPADDLWVMISLCKEGIRSYVLVQHSFHTPVSSTNLSGISQVSHFLGRFRHRAKKVIAAMIEALNLPRF